MVVSFCRLGVLRFYANRLEARLNEINLQIESYEMQEVDMRRALSTLTSRKRFTDIHRKIRYDSKCP